MSKQTYWEWLISETEYALKATMIDEKTGVTVDDIKLITSVLKDNVPFLAEELPFCSGDNKEEVK